MSAEPSRGWPYDDEALRLLVCPACGGALRVDGDDLCCEAEGLRYPVRDGVPLLHPDYVVVDAGAARRHRS